MTGLITTVTSLINAVFVDGGTENGTSWVSAVVSTITANPILMIGFILSIGGYAVGVVKRLTKLG